MRSNDFKYDIFLSQSTFRNHAHQILDGQAAGAVPMPN
jgi:hypothetical protein